MRGERDDPRANELIGLVGLLMYGWIFGHSAAYHPDPAEREWAGKELAWWVPQARRGLEAIGVACWRQRSFASTGGHRLGPGSERSGGSNLAADERVHQT